MGGPGPHPDNHCGEPARRLKRDVKRVHEDAAELVKLGLIDRSERGGLICPYADIHMDMHLRRAA